MKTPLLKLSCWTGIATLACAIGLHATELVWDANTTTTGAQDGSGSWTSLASNTNWWDGANNVTWNNATPDNATFGATNAPGATVTVPTSTTNTVGNITFNTPASGNYIIAAASTTASKLNLSGNPTITVANGLNSAINVVLSGTTFTKAGGGTLTNNPGNPNLTSGTTYVTGGTLIIGGLASSRILIPGDLIVTNSGSTAQLGASDNITNISTLYLYTGSTFNMNGKGQTLAGVVLDGNSTLNQSSSEALIVPGNFDARSGTVISASGKLDAGTFTKSTAGTVAFQPKGSAAATGGLTNTILNAGTLIFDYTDNSSKLNDTGTLTVNGGTLIFAIGTHTEVVGSVTIAGGVITNSSNTAKLSVPSGSYDVRAGAVYTVLAGAAGLTKTTSGTAVLAAVDTYAGGTLISTGILQLGDGNVNGTVSGNITDNDTLVLDPGSSATISSVISGIGSVIKIGGGTAAFTPINSYQGSTTISNGAISIDGDATLGDGTGTLNLSGGTLATTATRSVSTAPVANPINLTADSAITTTSTSTSTIDLNLNNNSISGTAGTLTFSNSGSGIGGVFVPRLSGSGFNFGQPMVIANGVNGTTRLDSYNTSGTTQTFSGPISGTGGYRRNSSISGNGGITVFSGTNTYTGNTDVSQGTVLVNGSLGSSTVSIGSNGMLGGNGTVNGPVTALSGGTVSAGTGIGVLTISNSLTFMSGSTNYVELNKSAPTNDFVRGLTTVTYAGTLVVANLGGTLALNDTFKLFDAANYTGSFDTTNLPPLDPSLAWDTSGLASNGTIKVVSASGTPTLNVSQSGGTLTFSWTDVSFKLQSQTNSLTVGLSTNWFDYPGGSTSPVGVTIDPANPSVFFRLSQ